MSYDPNFLMPVVYDGKIEILSELIANTIPDAQQVLIGSIATSDNQIFINKNTLYDTVNNSSEFSRYRFVIEVIYMAQGAITTEVMQRQADVARSLVNVFEKENIEFTLSDEEVNKFL